MGDQRPTGTLIHDAFSRHAAARPSSPALLSDGDRISYQVLESASNAYAAELAARGVGIGEIVPLLLPRSPQLVAVQLAVLKCGAAYANVDVQWPAARHAAIVRQVSPNVVVVGEDAAAVGGADGVDSLRLPPEDLSDVAARGAGFTPGTVDAAAPGTVFFTSGTTGVPKGVVVPHRAVTRLFGAGGLAGFGPNHVTPQAAALAWDMYAFELWGQLSSGGAVALVPEGHLLPGTLRELVRTADVDTVWLTTSLFNLFVDEDVDCFEGVQQLFIGGEKLSPAHVRGFLQRHPSIPLRNGYGPVENCMLTTTHLIRPEDCDISGGIPVGTPVPGTDLVLLTDEGHPCSPGESGEVCISGNGLAVGYLDQPEMTAEKFPMIDIGGRPVRIYRTGDIGVRDDDGVLHFRGRRDRQVKISGYRIELSEIEIAAREIDGLRQCHVVPLTAPDGQVNALALFYVAEPAAPGAPSPPGEPDVRAALARTLPAYLVPAVVRRLDHFPVTTNGKADQAELQRMAIRPRRSTR